MVSSYYRLKKPKVYESQILGYNLIKESHIQKFFNCLIWIKEPCVRKFEGLMHSKIFGIFKTALGIAVPSDQKDNDVLFKNGGSLKQEELATDLHDTKEPLCLKLTQYQLKQRSC